MALRLVSSILQMRPHQYIIQPGVHCTPNSKS